MTKQTHKAEVVALNEFHEIPKADRIVYTNVFGGFPCVVAKKDAKPGSLWVYIQPDSLVDVNRPEFKFLDAPGNGVRADRHARIKTRKFKKQQSMGLLIPAPKGAKEGDDLAEQLGIKHYEPKVKGPSRTEPDTMYNRMARKIMRRSKKYGEKPSSLVVPYYDIDALRRYPNAFEGKTVVVTEKIHGSNVAYCWESRGWLHKLFYWNRDHFFRVRSRTVWRKPEDKWYHCTAATEGVRKFVKETGLVLFGEVYGPGVQKGFDYGVTEPTFVAFDAFHQKLGWISRGVLTSFCKYYKIPVVPTLFVGTYDFDTVVALAEGKSELGGDHIREGVVVELLDPSEGPVRQLKAVGMGYYELSE
jgi:RNA ligase (TIGR02306 family)